MNISQDTKLIPLTQGKFAIVDADDYERLMQYKWCCNNSYAARRSKKSENTKRGIVYMHRLINQTPEGLDTDHINGNKLDNRKVNLRAVSRRENALNSAPRKNKASSYKGVWLDNSKPNRLWRCGIRHFGKMIYFGRYSTEEEARDVYEQKSIKYSGEFKYNNGE